MKRLTTIVLLFTCIGLTNLSAQHTQWPSTLLWRISGNGLTKNSFLYGTMHLQDKRLFNFGDSLYHYLEKADGYAMEIDLREFVDSILQKTINDREEEMYEAYDNNPKKQGKFIDSLLRNVKQYNDKASKKKLQQLRDEKQRRLLKNKEMPTVMDAYLYGIARRQGKWLGGVEDVQDQLAIYDELGKEVTREELLAEDQVMATYLEKMIAVYISQDLSKISDYASAEADRDYLLLKRNVKMAYRMDSLANIRSMFFAVGAAHLPGDSGVISLLREKGYTVDPVFSSKKIDPFVYASALPEIPWTKVEDQESTFSIEMPGTASSMDMFSGSVKMKMHMDMTTLTVYMAGSTKMASGTTLNNIFETFSNNVSGKIADKKIFKKDGIEGLECTFSANGYFYRAHYLIKNQLAYILVAGGENEDGAKSKDVERFFQSFHAAEKVRQDVQKEWTVFNDEEKAFKISFPGTPKRNKMIEEKAEGSEWIFSAHDFADPLLGLYYLVQVRDIHPGFNIVNDSAFFTSFRENYSQIVDSITKIEHLRLSSFPAMRLNGVSSKQGVSFKTLSIIRGNRVYILFAGGEESEVTEKAIDNFFNSFALTPYKNDAWKADKGPGFSTFVPFPIKEDKKEENPAKTSNSTSHFVSYSPNNSVSYEVFKKTMEPYYWVSNDSLFFEEVISTYKGTEDSTISKQAVKNGGLKGVEVVMQEKGDDKLKKLRFVLSGDTLYTLVSFIATQYFDEKEHNQFFEGFRVDNEIATSGIFKSKASKLMMDIQSTDSLTFITAVNGLSSAPFVKEDMPLLLDGLIRSYAGDTVWTYNVMGYRILEKLKDLADSSMVDSIRVVFPTLTGEKEPFKFNLLEALAQYKTAYSYSVLKDLLMNYTPRQIGDRELSYRLTDSIELAVTFFPEILRLSADSLLDERIISIANELLDSNAIKKEILLPYKQNFLKTANRLFKKFKGLDEYDAYDAVDVLSLLAKFNDAECNKQLQQYLSLEDLLIKSEAAIHLLKNRQPVAAIHFQKVAADKSYRRDLYDSLQSIGRLQLFPAQYATQRSLAESDIYRYGSDDDYDGLSVKFVGERFSTYKGERKKFILFKLTYKMDGDEGTKESYLGVVGPFAASGTSAKTDNSATGAYYKEEFDEKKIAKQFSEYLESLKENEE